MAGKSNRITVHIAASILAVVLIVLYGWRANEFLISHLHVASDWTSSRRIVELQPLLLIAVLAGAVVRLPHHFDMWMGPKLSDTVVLPRKRRHLRIDWRLLLVQGLPALLLMEFLSLVLIIDQVIWGQPLVWLPFEVIVVMGLGEFTLNSLAAFWLGGTLVDALELVE